MLRRIKNSLIYYAVRSIVAILGRTPRCLVSAVGRLLGSIACRVAGTEFRIAEKQLACALGLPIPGRRVRRLARGVFRELATSVVELAGVLGASHRIPRVEVSPASRRVLDEALAAGKGVIFITGHIGNWELMAIALARLGYPISTVARKSYDPRFTRWIHRERKRFGVEAVYRHDRGAAAAMLRALRKGRVLGFLIDQDTRVPSVFVPFFHKDASTPVGPGVFAQRTGAPVVVGSIRRFPDGGHRIALEALAVPGDAAGATQMMTARLERRIRRHPTQWVWFHRRWNTRPDEEAA